MITPLEIRKLEFKKVMRGCDPEEVQSALDSIARDFEQKVRDHSELGEKLKLAEERLGHFRLIEKTLQDSVLTLQTTLEEKKKTADHESQLILQEARQKAQQEYRLSLDQVNALRQEMAILQSQKSKYFIRFKNFLVSQLEWLKTLEREESQDGLDTPTPANKAEPENRAHRG